MSIDLSQFHGAFYEESFEAVAQMEQALLALDGGASDAELINTIFRVAHSIKGGAATFGFAQISSFTHSLEALLDELRGRRLQVSRGLSDLLLESVDLLREMLRTQQAGRPPDEQRIADLQFDLERAVAGKGPRSAPGGPQLQPARALRHAYRIEFRPHRQLLARGNDPLRLFHELRELGELQVLADPSSVPALERLDPEGCYLSWTLQLRTDAHRAAVLEVFDWAAGDCALEVIELDAKPAKPAGAAGARSTADSAGRGAPAPQPVTSPAAAASASAHQGHDSGSIRVSVDKIDELMNYVGELVITQSMLGELADRLAGDAGDRLRGALAPLGRNVRDLQESVMRVRMVPISFVFSRFPRMVRDLGQRLGKQVQLQMTGADTELDKTVLEKIGDPLVHLVRNSIDHGIETPGQRIEAGKDPCGTVRLHAFHRGSSISVEVGDDGCGLQRERILARARERGLVVAGEPPSDEAVLNLIFLPGFSTTEVANDVSGRGVGLDVVRRNVEALGGGIEVHSQPGLGTRFRITLPLTLAIVDGQTVAVGEESYIVPLTAIVESLQIGSASISQVVGHGELVSFRGEHLPVIRLEQRFQVRSRNPATERGLIMVVEGDGRRVGLCVDQLLGQQQVVVKTLEANYGQVEGIAGATILGDGSVALILDIAGLARSACQALAA